MTPVAASPGGRPNGDAPTYFFHHASYVPGYFLVPGVFNDTVRGNLYADLWLCEGPGARRPPYSILAPPFYPPILLLRQQLPTHAAQP